MLNNEHLKVMESKNFFELIPISLHNRFGGGPDWNLRV